MDAVYHRHDISDKALVVFSDSAPLTTLPG